MRKRTLAPYHLNQSQISQESLVSNSSSSRSFISNVQPYKPSESHLPTTQLHLIQTLGLKFTINESPTQMFVNFLTQKIDSAVVLEEYEAQNQILYTQAVGEHKQLQYLRMKQISQIQFIKMKPSQSIYKHVIKMVLLCAKYVSGFCRSVLTMPLFEVLTTLVIIGNSFVIAASDPLSQTHSALEVNFEIFFLSFYVFEALLKIFAYGIIIHKQAYLRDGWNIMDLLIIFTSIIQFFTYVGFSANSLRTFRVLRPLRTITKFSSLKMVIKTLFASLPLVFDSIILLGIAIIIFSILGVQVYGGLLKYRCMDIASGIFIDSLCSSTQSCSNFGSAFVCAKGISSPNHSIENFDSISWAFISIFQILTMEGWSDIMLDLESAFNITGAIYTICIIFVCELALLNITLAILKFKFSEIRSKEAEIPVVQAEGYDIQALKKIGAYQHFSNVKQGTFVPDIFLDRIGASMINKHPLFAEKLALRKKKRHEKYNRISSQTRSVKRHQSHDINRSSNCKHIRILDEIVGDTYTHPIHIKEIEFKIQNDNYWRDQEQSPLIQSLHESQDEIKTEKLMDNNNFQSQEYREAQEKNALMFSLLNSKLKGVADKPQIQQFIENMHENNIIWDFNPPEEIPHRNEEFLEIVLHRRKANQFLNLEKKKARSNGEKKTNPRTTARKSIQELRKEREMDLEDIKLISEISKKELVFQIRRDIEFNAVFVQKSQQIFVEKAGEQRGDSVQKHISVSYSNIWQSRKLEGFLKIPLRPMVNKIRRTNKIINTHFMTEQQEKQTESDNLDPQPKEMFKITFSSNTKPIKHRFSRRSISRVYTLQEIDRFYFINRNFVQKEEDESAAKILDIEGINEEMVTRSTETNQEKWNRICVQENILTKIEMTYPPLDILKETEVKRFINVFPVRTDYNIYIPGFFGCLKILRNYFTILLQSTAYDNIILSLVVLNTLVLTSSPDADTQFQSGSNLIFTSVFTLDIILKIIVYGLNFFQDFLNVFDLLVVILGIFQLLIIGESSTNVSAFRSIRIFRVFRVLRMARLIRYMSFMSVISDIVAGVFYEFIYIFLLLGLFLFVYVLLGMQIFGGSFVPQKISGVRQNFDTFGNAFFAIFQLITVENWDDIESALILSSTNSSSIIYLMAGIFIGNWILLNLVQAILLQNFEIERLKIKQQREERKLNRNALKSTEHLDESNFQQSYSISHSKSRSKSKSLTFSKTYDNKTTASRLYFLPNDYSLWLFKPSNPFRTICLKIVTSKYFTFIIYLMIIISCGKLIFDTYINNDDYLLQTISGDINTVINVWFFIEFLLKIIALGFAFSPKAYLRDNWNKLDFFIVICSILDFFSTSNNIGIIKVFRALRPLKLISKNLRMKIMIQALFQSANGLANVGVVVLLVFLMFGILFMNLLQNKLDYCDIGKGEIYGPYNMNEIDCLDQGFIWRTRIINFQNIVNALLSLFIFSSRQNWPFYHYSFVDANESGPVLDSNPGLFILLSFIFIFVCSYFLVDLFIGVIFLNYHMAEAKLNPRVLTPEQTNWIKLQKHIISTNPYFLLYSQPTNLIKQRLFNLLRHKYYQISISILLGVNTVVFMMEYDDMGSDYIRSILILNCSFTSIFILELLLKLIAFPIKEYFISVFNVLESLIILIAVIDFIQLAGYIQESALLDALKIIRIMRTFRLFRFIKTYKSLQKLVYILLYALPSIGCAASILCLYLLISSVISSTLFGNLIDDYTLMINQDSNFKDFHHALQMLFICLTGQNWYYYMFAAMNPDAKCGDNQVSCTSPYYIFFWLPFIFVGQKLIMELFVLLILDQFEDTFINQNNPLGLFNDLELIFKPAWIELASKKNWTLKASSSVDLCLKLESPLGLNSDSEFKKFQAELKSSLLSEEEVVRKNYMFLSSMKQSAMKWVSKLQLPNTSLHYNRTFYLFAKAVFFPDPEHCTQQQLLQLQQVEERAIETLCKMEGNNSTNTQETMNPFKRQLLIQIALEAWVNFVDVQFTKQAREGEDSILGEQEFELPTVRMIANQKQGKPKLKKATSIKLKRELSSKIKDKEIPNPETLYSRKGRVSL